MIIQHNMMEENGNRQLGVSRKGNASYTEQLSSGYRINRAADDAAGLTISEEMRGQIRGLQKASRNCEDGISLFQTADGAMQEVENIIHRMRELCVQGANDTNVTADREAIQIELDALRDEIDRMHEDTEFNTIKLFQNTKDIVIRKKTTIISTQSVEVVEVPGGTISNMDVRNSMAQIIGREKVSGAGKIDEPLDLTGPGWHKTFSDPIREADPVMSAHIDFSGLGTDYQKNDLYGLGFSSVCGHGCGIHYSVKFVENGGSSTTQSGYRYLMDGSGHAPVLEIDLSSINTGSDLVKAIVEAAGKERNMTRHWHQYAYNDADQNILYTYDYSGSKIRKGTFTAAAYTTDNKIDIPETIKKTKIVTTPQEIIEKQTSYRNKKYHLQVGANSNQDIKFELPYITSYTLGVDNIGVDNYEYATSSIRDCDHALDYINHERAVMGALQNRTEHAMENADNMSENLQTSESKIRDADMADMMVKYSKTQILMEAGVSMLSQTNKINEGILALLRA